MPATTGFIPEMVWDVDYYKQKGLYHHFLEVRDIRPDSARVTVQGHGKMIMFNSYSYLGLIGHPGINRAAREAIDLYGTGTNGARLLAGTLPVHHQLEEKIAEFTGTQAAVTYSSGYVTNVSTITSLIGKEGIRSSAIS